MDVSYWANKMGHENLQQNQKFALKSVVFYNIRLNMVLYERSMSILLDISIKSSYEVKLWPKIAKFIHFIRTFLLIVALAFVGRKK